MIIKISDSWRCRYFCKSNQMDLDVKVHVVNFIINSTNLINSSIASPSIKNIYPTVNPEVEFSEIETRCRGGFAIAV